MVISALVGFLVRNVQPGVQNAPVLELRMAEEAENVL